MPLPLARALCPLAQVFLHSPLKDYKALERLAVRALKFAPFAGVDSDLQAAYKAGVLESCSQYHYGIVLDITGTERLYQSERLLAEKIAARCAVFTIQARIAIAATIGAAWGLSRFGSASLHIAPRGSSLKESLAGLPVEALRLPVDTIQALQSLGLRSIADVVRLPSKQLTARFGMDLLKRLDQAFGAIEETFTPVEPPELIRAFHRFEEPLTNQQAVQTATLFLLQHILKGLFAKKKKAGAFILIVEGKDAQHQTFKRSKELLLNTSTKNFKHIATVLEPIIQTLIIPGGIHALTVIAQDVERAHEEQSNFLSPADIHFILQSSDELLNSLVARLGRDHVAVVTFQNSHIPERSYAYEPLPRNKKSRAAQPMTRPLSSARPPYLFKRPEPITAVAMLPDKPPARVYWKGAELTITHADGPERISPEWWHLQLRSNESEREYFRLQDQHGRWLWVYRERDSLRWFVHGVWT